MQTIKQILKNLHVHIVGQNNIFEIIDLYEMLSLLLKIKKKTI